MLLSTLATIGGIGSAIYGAVKSSQYNKKAERAIDNNYSDTSRILQSRLHSDYTQRSDFQNILNRQKELLDMQYKREKGVNAVVGGNDSAVFAQKQADARATAQTMSNIASGASAFKDRTQDQILAQNANYTAQKANLAQNQAKTIANATGQVTKAMSGIIANDKNTWADDAVSMFGLRDKYEWDENTGHYRRKPKEDTGTVA